MRARALLLYSKYTLESFSEEHVFEVGKKIIERMTE
jgi:hypothetical protein